MRYNKEKVTQAMKAKINALIQRGEKKQVQQNKLLKNKPNKFYIIFTI